MNKIIFFDCDGTLRKAADNDYISSCISDCTLITKDTIQRDKDKKTFSLRGDTKKALQKLKNKGYTLGIISDNNYEATIQALKIFDIRKYFDQECIDISSWQGYCPKAMIIKNILYNKTYDEVTLFDDKDYSQEMTKEGYHFYLCGKHNSLDTEIADFLGN